MALQLKRLNDSYENLKSSEDFQTSEENKKSRRRSACIDLRARNTKKSANMHSKVACATG